MDLVLCEKGHYYDASIHASCPQCAAEAGGAGSFGMGYGAAGGYGGVGPTEPVSGGYGGVGPTEPVGSGYGGVGPTEPVGMGAIQPTEPVGMNYGGIGPTFPVENPGFTSGDFVSGQGSVQDYGPTQPVWQNGVAGFNPVVGWLVCTEGPNRGADYRIHSGYNYIGRAQHMNICIPNDSHISHDRHALVGYDPESHMFFFAPSNGSNIVRVNGEPVINSVKLNAYDTLTVGTTKLIFIPLCSDHFSWDME